MKQIGIFYGSFTGTTEEIARKIGNKLGIGTEDIMDVSTLSEGKVACYDVLLLGSSTWGDGELQDDWYDGVELLKGMDLTGKIVALFGCGDSESYPDTFVDAIGILYEELQGTGCSFCGETDRSAYSFSGSRALKGDQLVGLAIDEINEDDQTDNRIAAWTEQLKGCIGA